MTVHARFISTYTSSVVSSTKTTKLSLPQRMTLSKNTLNVDYSYQRSTDMSRVRKMISEFDFRQLEALKVSKRSDGTFWVLDGAHRLAAVKEMPGISTVPCEVYQLGSIAEEAELFYKLNVKRKAPSNYDNHKALVVAKEPIALMIEALVESAGRVVGKASGAHSFNAIGRLRSLITRDAKLVSHIWAAFRLICEGNTMHEYILVGLFALEQRLRTMNSPRSIIDPMYLKNLTRAGYDEILRQINAEATLGRGSLNASAARAIAVVASRGLRASNRLDNF